jgi:PAS domain S-box-containing protein
MKKNTPSNISNPQSLHVLMVEDSEDDALLIIRELKKGGYNPVHERVETAAAMKKALQEKQWDIILCDYKIPKFSGAHAIALLQETNIDIPLIIVSGTIGEETALECMRSGAHDYIMKNNLSRLCLAVGRELEEAEVIVQRKRMGEDLEESENKYRLSFENVTDVIYTIDKDLNILSVSPSVERVLGYKPQDFIGQPVSALGNILTPESFEQAIANISVILKGETISLMVYRFIAKDGTIKYGEVSGSPMMRNGKIIGIISVARNITERKRAENALQVSEKYFKEITENSSDIIVITDKNGDIKYCSRSTERFTGYKPEELIGRNVIRIIHPDDVKRAVGDFGKAILAKDSAIPNGFRIVHKDGSERYFEGLGKNLLDNPSVAGFIMNVHDTTERKQADEALRESERKYKSLIDNFQDIILTINLEGKITFASQSIKEKLGYESAETINMSILDFVQEEDHQRVMENLQKGMKGEKITGFQIQVITKSGKRVFFESFFSRVYKDGEVVGAQAIIKDITESKRAEEELKQSFERMRKALGATVQSISMIVEMKDPYTAGHQQRVSDLARAISTEMGLSADQRDFIRTASAIHDIGKISIPAEILSKSTKLTDMEFNLIKTHAQSGHDILKDIEFPWPVADVVLQHHERMDGSGYPQGLKGNDIFLEARIMAVADVVEAMASHRPYRPSLGIDCALDEISRNKGILYDADVVDACLKLFQEKGYTLVFKKS